MRIYSDSTVVMMELKDSVDAKSLIIIQEVTLANVKDALNFQSKGQVQRFSSFLQRGDKGYYGYLDKRCVHRSWVVQGPAKVSLHKFYWVNIKENQVFIQYCETAPEVRGKNIFAHMLSHIGKEYPASRVLTSVDEKNSSSIRSMIKAGFEEIYRKRIKMILGIRFIS